MKTELLSCALLAACSAHAATVVIGSGGGRLILQIGSTGGGVNQVNFSVPGANVGNGVAVTSTNVTPASPTCPGNTVLIDIQARSQNSNPRTATLSVNGTKVADGRLPKTNAFMFSLDEGADVGMDQDTPVADAYRAGADSRFSGRIDRVTVQVR